MLPSKKIAVLLLLTNTLSTERWSGIHRVAIELARHMGNASTLDLVRWDDQDGQLRFADAIDLARVFPDGQRPPGITLRRSAHKVRYRFSDELSPEFDYWLLNPEIAYHSISGNESFACLISQCREYGVRVASIIYDLIPITNNAYSVYSKPHVSYMSEVFRSDILIPISAQVGKEVETFFRKLAPEARQPTISSILLPECSGSHKSVRAVRDWDHRDTITLIGTVEPRKQQVEFLEAFINGSRRCSKLANLSIFIAGSLHPDVAVEFRSLLGQIPTSHYADYADQSLIEDVFAKTRFSVFASNDEGFGLPIAESLARGIPCLCANFGSMKEIAAGGGCMAVDVNSPIALEEALIALAENDSVLERLAAEIDQRPFRSWADYASEIASVLQRTEISLSRDLPIYHLKLAEIESATFGDFLLWNEAEVLAFDDRETRDAFVIRANDVAFDRVFPLLAVKPDIETAVRDRSERRARSKAISYVEADYRRIKKRASRTMEPRSYFLRIIVSTYNRAAFVRENVRWLLESVAVTGSGIQVVVVDNASVDDSLDRLVEFVGHPNYQIIRNTANTGMLGNLKICSTLAGAEYVWVIGDDDFIIPAQISNILASLNRHFGVPLACLNFGVYHRFALSAGDNAQLLINEHVPLAKHFAPSSLIPLREAAEQHDNLFTAIYPIIWRRDVLAACFNYPFTGEPFKNLVESVPTTKLLLESYGESEVYWHAPISIAGNAHNSWSRHRPRWHGKLMPDVFELARFAGVSPKALYSWASVHENLFLEALASSKEQGVPVNLEEADFDVSWRILRRRLQVTLV